MEAGDVVRGFVTCKRHGDLMVQVMSFVDSPKLREFSDLDIQVQCVCVCVNSELSMAVPNI